MPLNPSWKKWISVRPVRSFEETPHKHTSDCDGCLTVLDVGRGTRPWESLWQLPIQRVDLLATDVADDYGRTIWSHAAPFAPLREKPADFAQAYDALDLSITY